MTSAAAVITELTTKDVIARMLTENTGRHMLDSGGAYGRHWERNQGRDFTKEPAATVDFRHGEIDVTRNVYHFLVSRLDYAPRWQRHFDALARMMPEDGWGTIIATWWERLGLHHTVGGGPYGEGFTPWSGYTYNEDNLLSQDIMYSWGTIDDACVVVLQIHNGCDARGGFTAPRIFFADDSFADWSRASISCAGDPTFNPNQLVIAGTVPVECEHHMWDTDDGSRWSANEATCDLDDVETFTSHDVENGVDGDTLDSRKGTGVMVVDDDGNAFCPECGGKLDVNVW